MHRILSCALALVCSVNAAPILDAPASGESIVLIGNGLGERMVDHPYF